MTDARRESGAHVANCSSARVILPTASIPVIHHAMLRLLSMQARAT
jgi:hypothetical protein